MSIVYYPNRVYKGQVPAIDRVMAKRKLLSASGAQNTASTALSAIISSNTDWMIDSISFTFSGTASRDFAAYIANGRTVVQNLNDYLWFYVPETPRQKITLTPGFYTGTELAAELETQLNTNSVYAAAGITFTVTYTDATGIYVITPAATTISYVDKNYQRDFRERDSIAGQLFGLVLSGNNYTTALAVNVSSTVPVCGLDTEVPVINQTASVVTSYYQNTLHMLTMDQALVLASNAGASITTEYNVVYESVV